MSDTTNTNPLHSYVSSGGPQMPWMDCEGRVVMYCPACRKQWVRTLRPLEVAAAFAIQGPDPMTDALLRYIEALGG